MLRFAFILLAVTAATAQGNFDRTIPASAQNDLYVSDSSGHIHVSAGNGSQIHISAHLRAGWNVGGDVQDRIRRIVANPPIQVSGNGVRVGDMRAAERELYNNITIDYDISAPAGVALNLRTGSGDVEIDNVGRFAKVDCGSGSVRVHGLAGPADLHSGSGDVELEERGSGDVRASSGSGSVRVTGLRGGAMLRSGSGDLEINGQLSAPADLQTGSGSIRLHLGRDARFHVDASTGSGSIRIAQIGASHGSDENHHVSGAANGGGPQLKASTGSGDIEIN